MKITRIDITDIRSFAGNHTFNLSPKINILVGKNNSGKSTLLRCLHLLQPGNSDVSYMPTLGRKGTAQSKVTVGFERIDERARPLIGGRMNEKTINPWITCIPQGMNRRFFAGGLDGIHGNKIEEETGTNREFLAKEPGSVFIPFFSKRKTVIFENKTDVNSTLSVHDTLRHLSAKVSRMVNSGDETSAEFIDLCKKIVGCRIGISPTENGSDTGIWLSHTDHISVAAMGEGTAHIVGLIAELCTAVDKIFLIEELENDIHPSALKALLDLVINKSNRNQFIISTHSNIVLKFLGADQHTKIFSFSMEYVNKLPTSSCIEIDQSEDARRAVLQDLGYELFDFGLWQAYLILEESSAESVINNIVIPNFVPSLATRLRTISANGNQKVSSSYEDLHRLFVFLHTSKIYYDKSWVRIDGDTEGKEIIQQLREKFATTPSDRFGCLQQPAFECYYPERFQNEAKSALKLEQKKSVEPPKRPYAKKF